jgi:hypothetical protein
MADTVTPNPRTPEQLAEDQRQRELLTAHIQALAGTQSPRGESLALHSINTPMTPSVATTPEAITSKVRSVQTPEASEVGTIAPTPPTLPNIGEPKTLPMLSPAPKAGLPNLSEPPRPGSATDLENQLTKLRSTDTLADHDTKLGKIGHVLGRIGNIAGDIFAPATMALIPHTDLNRQMQINRITPQLERAKAQEETAAERKAAGGLAERKESSEEDLRTAQTKNLNEKDSAALAEHGLTRDEEGNVKPDPTSPVYQKNQLAMDTVKNVQTYRQAQQELVQAKTEVERAKNDPNSPAFKAAQQRLAMAQEAHRIAAQNLALHEQEFSDKQQEREFLKPSGQAQSRGSAAQAVLNLMPDLDKLVKSNAAEMGPIMGRLNRGEIAIGDVDPKVAELYSAMKSFYALQPAVHGFRNAEFVKDFEHALGTLERDPDAFLAGMHGLEPTMKAVANEGVTFHKRIKEGAPATPNAPAAGGAANETPFEKWQRENKKP